MNNNMSKMARIDSHDFDFKNNYEKQKFNYFYVCRIEIRYE